MVAQAALTDTLTGNPVLTQASGEAQMKLWDTTEKGGWIMIVLAVLSVVCFYIFFERLAVIRRAGKDDPLFMERIRDYIRTGEIKSALNYCRITNTPAAHMIEKGPGCTGGHREHGKYRNRQDGKRISHRVDHRQRRPHDRFPRNGDRHGESLFRNG